MQFETNRLVLSERHKTVGLKLGKIGLIVVDYAAGVAVPDEVAAAIFGVAADEPMQRDSFHNCIHADDRETIVALVDDLILSQDEDVTEFTHRIHGANGEVRWVHARKQLYRDPESAPGTAVSAVAAVQDITERKRADEANEYLMRELQHRTLNVTAIVSALARMVYDAGPADQFWKRFEPRVQNLVRNMRLNVKGERIGLRDALDAALSPYRNPQSQTVTIEGDDVALDAQQSQTFAMVFHELATNSLKHGALGGHNPKLTISATREAPDRFLFRWEETRTEPAPASKRVGFGTQILEDFAAISLGGSASQALTDESYLYEVRFRPGA